MTIAKPKTSKLALVSMVLGVVSLVISLSLRIFFPTRVARSSPPSDFELAALALLLAGLFAGLLGLAALRSIESNPCRLSGKGVATTGVLAGVLQVMSSIALVSEGPRNSAARLNSVNNLKQIGIALHDYHSKFQHFPSEAPGIRNGSGPTASKLSWRVQILPFLESQDLYNEFHHDEDWDSPHNLKLLARMPQIYCDPRFQPRYEPEKGITYYRGFVGPGSVLGGDPGVTLDAMMKKNGASNTLVVVEAGEPVPWTKPEDPSFDENSPFGGPDKAKVFAVLFADGHVQTLAQSFDREMIRRMIDWRNTQPVNLP